MTCGGQAYRDTSKLGWEEHYVQDTWRGECPLSVQDTWWGECPVRCPLSASECGSLSSNAGPPALLSCPWDQNDKVSGLLC